MFENSFASWKFGQDGIGGLVVGMLWLYGNCRDGAIVCNFYP